MSVREARNASKIEGWRLSRVPIDPTETIYQGDMMAWDATNKRATKLTLAASAATFMGVSDTTNPVQAIGVLSSPFQRAICNLLQEGLVEMIEDTAETVYPFDTLTVGADSQSVHKGGSNIVGIADCAVGSAGKLYAVGDYILMWLRVPAAYKVWA